VIAVRILGAILLVACGHTSAPVEGPLPQRAIDRVVRRHEDDVRACYDIGLSRDPGLRGTLRLVLTIDPSGAPKDVAVRDSTLAHAEVERCLVAVAGRWRFPSATASTPVELPLYFAAEEDFEDPPLPP